jgi:hypothetical protein
MVLIGLSKAFAGIAFNNLTELIHNLPLGVASGLSFTAAFTALAIFAFAFSTFAFAIFAALANI